MEKNIIETNFESAKKWPGGEYIDNDILLLDRLDCAPFPKGSRRLNFIIIILCTNGTAKLQLDGQSLELMAGNLMVVSERHLIEIYESSSDFQGLCMMVSMPFYSEIIRSVGDVSALFLFSHNHPVFPLPERDQEVFRDYFYVIQKKIRATENHFRRNLVRTLMLAMFYDLSNLIFHFQQVSERRPIRADAVFTKFIKLVEENCKHERRVSWYAKQLCITPKYLSELVKNVSKRTPNEWIDNYVALELRLILKNSTKSIKEITKEMNFPNQSFLGKYFKEHVGISPSKYRRS
jgi:AraC-like DNA-binding protein